MNELQGERLLPDSKFSSEESKPRFSMGRSSYTQVTHTLRLPLRAWTFLSLYGAIGMVLDPETLRWDSPLPLRAEARRIVVKWAAVAVDRCRTSHSVPRSVDLITCMLPSIFTSQW